MKLNITRSAETAKRLAKESVAAARLAVREARRAAFVAEADPMAFELLRGEVSPEAYAAKVAEIRARHPFEKEAGMADQGPSV